jgi:glycosyltransferase involved in cell wall biosynthesis
MRITFVLARDNLSGGNRVLATYADRLGRQGHEVVVLAEGPPRTTLYRRARNLLRGREAAPAGIYQGSHFTGLDVDYRVRPDDAPVRDGTVPDADAVIATWWETAPGVAALSARKGVPVYFIQGYEATIPGQPADRVDATWRLPLSKIVVARWLAQLARDRFGDPHAAVVPNSVDRELFWAPPRGKNPVPTVGFVYSPSLMKGCDLGIAAVTRVRATVPGLRVVAFGAGDPVPEFRLPGWVEYRRLPAQPLIRSIYASADVWLLPSRSEGFGLPMLEAMACRTPVVAAAAGAAPDLLEQGGGRLVPAGDADALATAIAEVLGLSDESWRQLSAQAHARACNYSWDDATERFAAALQAAVERTPGVARVPPHAGRPARGPRVAS